jgi:hypothetical protein
MIDTTITFPRSTEPLTPLLNNPSPAAPQEPLTPIVDHSTPASTSDISPAATILSQLQQTQEHNPVGYPAVATSIASQLTSDATTAQSNSDTLTKTLTQLAAVFQNSAQTGQVPTPQALQQAGFSGHHHRHGHHATSSTTSAASSNDSVASLLASAISKAIGS